MTDRPYTDEDLRAEAARQHSVLADDPDFMGVGEQMEYAFIDSTDDNDPDGIEDSGSTWDEALDREQFSEAQKKIHSLIQGAADLSDWAVNLGADGLEPSDERVDIAEDDQPLVRIHFAFHPDMPDELRQKVIAAVRDETAA